MALPALPLVAPVADAQTSADPWWGPSDIAHPTNGWAIRMPVIVENDRPYLLDSPLVAVEVDFGKLLVESGWTNRTSGTETTVRGFTLDVDSIRVVEYQSGFSGGPIKGPGTPPTPHLFYKAPFTGVHRRDFDASSNPSGTVLFQIRNNADGSQFQPGQRRYFYIYANPLEYGKTPPPVFNLAERAPLDAFLWGSSGTAFYGDEPLQTGLTNQMSLKTTSGFPTHVLISSYSLGRFTPLPSTETLSNPFDMNSGQTGSVRVISGLPTGQPYRIESDRPLVVQATGRFDPGAPWENEAWGFVPATNGSFAGTDFDVFGAKKLPASGGSETVTVYRAEGYHGDIHIAVSGPFFGTNTIPAEITPTMTATSVRLSSNSFSSNAWYHLTATGGNILVSYGNLTAAGFEKPSTPFPTFPVPALTGGVIGDDFYAAIPRDGGYFLICPQEPLQLRIVDTLHTSQQVLPQGPVESTAPLTLLPQDGCVEKKATASTPETLLELYTVRGADGSPPGKFRLMVGARDRVLPENERSMIGNYAGAGGVDFWVTATSDAPVGVFGVYNDTRVATYYSRERNGLALADLNGSVFAVSDGSFQTLSTASLPDATGRIHIVANKPISVISLPQSYDRSYEHIVPGRPVMPHYTLGHMEFRGPLVEVRSREKPGRQDFRSAGPGSPVTFPLEVANLGQWIGGANLDDAIAVTCTGPDGWQLDGCAKDLRLGSRQGSRLDVTITPPSDAVNVNGTFVVTGKSKAAANVTSEFKLIVFVEIRYGVGLWFDEVGGRKTFDPPAEVDPGGMYPYKIVVKNTGSARDTFDISAPPNNLATQQGWSQTLTIDGEPVTKVTLDAGETRTLAFDVTAPKTESAVQDLVSVTAQSESSALAADIVNTQTRIRPKINIALTVNPTTRIAAPNETVAFNLTVNNSGNDIFRITFRQDSLLPKGWTARLGITEIDLGPGTPFTFPLYVTPPDGARANDLATVKIAAETDTGTGSSTLGDVVSAVVVVKKIHDITVPPLFDEPAQPGETLRYVLNATNGGNGNDVIELLDGAVTPAGWKIDPLVAPLALDVGATDDLPLVIHVPNGTPPGLVNLTFTMRLSREAFQNLTIPIQVAEAAEISFTGLPPLALAPGRSETLVLTATNVGNIEGDFAFHASLPAGWNATFSPERQRLRPGDSLPVTVSLNASRDSADGPYDLALTASLAGRPAGSTSGNATLARPELFLAKIEPSGTVASGELVLVSATVGNRGAIAAENVTIELVVDGQAVDSVSIARISVNDQKVATLHWLATKRTSDIRVVIDPDHTLVESGNLADHAASVRFAGKLPVPAPTLGFIIVVGLVAVMLFGRRRS